MSKSIEMRQTPYVVPTAEYDVAIVGAGPYGLATAAHLSQQGLGVIVFGKPMQLWREHMPLGMLLRSYWWATNISDPKKQSYHYPYLFWTLCGEGFILQSLCTSSTILTGLLSTF